MKRGMEEDPAPRLHIRLFGAFEVRVNGVPIPQLRSRKVQWLLALLVLRHDQPLDRTWLAGTLWPDSTHAQSLYNLRQSLSNLRQTLAEAGPCLQPTQVNALTMDVSGAEVDVLAFDAGIADGQIASLQRAVALYRGPLLEGCAEEWALLERRAREENYLTALETLAVGALAHGEGAAAVAWLRSVIQVDPLREQAQRALLQALAAVGDYGAAVQTYRDLRLLLRRELNTDPDPQTRTLFDQIRREARSRLQGAPLRPLPTQSTPPRRLPCALTELVGRQAQVHQIVEELRSARLLTLTGTGGVGKTRLALAVAEEIAEEYPDGVFFVDLAPLSDPALIAQTVAGALAIREEGGRGLLSTLQEHLQTRTLLLFIDNCEHLLDGCARLAQTLLGHCRGLSILATSRQALGLTGEVAWRVPSMLTPAVSWLGSRDGPLQKDWVSLLGEYESVELFVRRARAARPSFAMSAENAEAIAQICVQLDGIPLAIELAAARLRSLSVGEIQRRLDDRFRLLTGGSRTALPRQQTLRGLMDWSYDLLSAEERDLLRRLSIFAGSWTLEAAEKVCGGASLQGEHGEGIEERDLLDLLASLIEKSLVVAETTEVRTRYRLLETVRQYSWERLVESGESEWVSERHQAYYLEFATVAKPELTGPAQAVWMELMEREHDNVRQALERGSQATALRIIAEVWNFWFLRGHFSEGRQRLASVLAGDAAREPTPTRARILCGAGALAWSQGDYQEARTLQEESLALSRKWEDRSGMAASLRSLGMIAYVQCDYAMAHTFFADSLTLFRDEQDKRGAAASIGNLGNVAYVQGDYTSAQTRYEESLALQREVGNTRGIAASLNNLGIVAYEQGDYESARRFYAESLPLYEELGDRVGIAFSLVNLGNIFIDQGDYLSARPLIEASLKLRRELGDRRGIASSLNSMSNVAYEQRDYALARTLLEESLHLCQDLGNKGGIVFAFEGFATLAFKLEQPRRAARLWGAAEALRELINASIPPCELPHYHRLLDQACEAVGQEAFSNAWSEGSRFTLEQAIEYALASTTP